MIHDLETSDMDLASVETQYEFGKRLCNFLIKTQPSDGHALNILLDAELGEVHITWRVEHAT